MIPKNITKVEILKAIKELNETGIPKNRQSKKYYVQHDGKLYPPKLIISLANKYINGYELKPEVFGGGVETNKFIENLGFSVTENKLSISISQKVIHTFKKKLRHTERCKDCKENFYTYLSSIYGLVEKNYQLEIGTHLSNYSSHNYFDSLFTIYYELIAYRNNHSFIKTNKMPKVDFFIVGNNQIVEFDESQHFTEARKISLKNYPEDLPLGFDKEKWISLCNKYNSKDHSPIYRDEQRAWYDTLRDFAPGILGLKPTIRIHASDEEWCKLELKNKSDEKKFHKYLGISQIKDDNEFYVSVIKSPNPKIGRIILAFDWSSDINNAKNILNRACDIWPNNTKVYFLLTPGAFIGFDIPNDLFEGYDNKEPPISIQLRLFNIAENACYKLLDANLRKKLSKVTRYISIGVDSFKSKVSLSNVKIRNPHAELVCLYDLQEDKFFWTGKSFPTVGQEDGLIRVTDQNSHFVETEFGKTMLLGCHDLSIYSNRGSSTTKNEWRRKIRSNFRVLAKGQKPQIVLHHPHNTDSSLTWTSSWNELQREIPAVKIYAGAGKYFRENGTQRSKRSDVLNNNKQGNTIDLIFE